MFKGKYLLAMILIVAIISSLFISSFAADTLKVSVDGSVLKLSATPIVVGNDAFVPAKDVFEALGGIVTVSDSGLSIATAQKTINLTNSSDITQVQKGVLLVKASYINTALGADVKVDTANSTVIIKYFSNMSGTLKLGGSTTVQPITQAAADYLMKLNKGLSVTVAGGGSGAGKSGAKDGTFNIGATSSEWSDSDKATFPELKTYMIAKDAIAVIVNPSNKIKNLTKQQVKDLFEGKITNWYKIGGNNAAVMVQTREATSGTLSAFAELALENKKGVEITKTAPPHGSNGLMLQAVSSNKNAIGFLSLGYLNSKVKAVTLDGVVCNVANANSKKYSLVRPLLLLTKGAPGDLAAVYMNFLTSPKGQAMMASNGYLTLR